MKTIVETWTTMSNTRPFGAAGKEVEMETGVETGVVTDMEDLDLAPTEIVVATVPLLLPKAMEVQVEAMVREVMGVPAMVTREGMVVETRATVSEETGATVEETGASVREQVTVLPQQLGDKQTTGAEVVELVGAMVVMVPQEVAAGSRSLPMEADTRWWTLLLPRLRLRTGHC